MIGTKNILFISSLLLLVTACSIKPNPNEAGLFDSMYHLSKGTYQQRRMNKQLKLEQLNRHQQDKKKQLQALNKELQQKQQESVATKKSLQGSRKQHRLIKHQLQVSKKRYASSKQLHAKLQKQITTLDEDIKREKAQTKRQATYISALQKERNILRKEIIMQSSTP